MRRLVNYLADLREMAEILRTENTSEVERRQLSTVVEQAMMLRNLRVQTSGAQRMDRIIELATTLPGYELSYFQRCCLDATLPIVAPVVFRGGTAQDVAEWFTKTGRKMSLLRMAFFLCSRRSGKTDFLTIMAAIFLVVLPNLEQLGWSLYNDTSELFGRTMSKWIIDLGYEKFVSVSSDHVIVTTEFSEDIRVMYLQGSQNPHVSERGQAPFRTPHLYAYAKVIP